MARQRERDVEVEDDDVDLTSKKAGDFNADGTLVKDSDLSAEDDDVEFDDGPDNAAARKQAEDDARRKGRKAASDEDVEDEVDTRVAYDDDDDEGPQERGTSRRARRNARRRQARDESATVIAQQDQRIRQLEGAMQQLGVAQLNLHAGDIDGQIAGLQQQLATIDRAFATAITEGDKVTLTRAMGLRDEARDRLQSLGIERQRLEALARQGQQPLQQPGPQRPRGQVDVDPIAERFSNKFMDRHPWFDPLDNQDEDSQLVKAIDDTLVNEGYKPNTKRYWVELEQRVRSRGLGQNDMGEQDDGYSNRDDQDERYARTQRRKSGGLPPRSARGGGGHRPGEGGGDRDLPALAKDSLEQMGLLDKNGLSKEQLAERQNYITVWRKGLKEARAQGKL